MGKNLKVLGLSLLTLVGVMAMSASASQAKWLLLRNGTSTLELNLSVIQSTAGELLTELGITINCTGGSGSVTAKLEEEHKKLVVSGKITFTGCTVLEFPECEVLGPKKGEIEASGSGIGIENGSGEVFADLSGTFVKLITFPKDVHCVLSDIEWNVKGKVHVKVLEPLANNKLHVGHLLDLGLDFFGFTAELHASGSKGPIPLSITESTGATWAVHLVNL